MRRAAAGTVVAVAVVALAHLGLRLPSLGLLPLYSDEALGLWRAERVLEGSLTRGAGEGKPLHAWMIAAAVALPGDDIRAARAAHAVAGALTAVVLWGCARRHLSPAAGWTAAALWIVLPFPLLFERTVTPDVPLAAATVAVLACALQVMTVSDRAAARRWLAALLVAGAAATFVKMPLGPVLAATPAVLPWALPPLERAAARRRLRPYLLALGLVVGVLGAIVVTRAALGLRPVGFGMHELGLKVAAVRDPGGAGGAAARNLLLVIEFSWLYLTPAGIALLVAGSIGAWFRRHRLLCALTAVATVYTIAFVSSAVSLSAHYLLAALALYVPAMAWGLAEGAAAVGRRFAPALIALVLLLIAARTVPLARALWSDPPSAALASTEREHYVEGRWAGYGLPEAARWIEREHAARGGDVFVAVHLADYERLRRYAAPPARAAIVQVQVERRGIPFTAKVERTRSLAAAGGRVYVVAGSRTRFHQRWREAFPGATLAIEFPRPAGDQAVEVWALP
jgi:hypothetical protein